MAVFSLVSLIFSGCLMVHAGVEGQFLESLRADPPDAIVVLGSTIVPGRNMHRRINGAAAVYQALESKPDLILSGGNPRSPARTLTAIETSCALRRALVERDGRRRARAERGQPLYFSEAETMCALLAKEHGLPLDRLFPEGRSRTTVENATMSTAILKNARYRHVLILTTTEGEQNHALRALRSFQKQRKAVGSRAGYRLSAVSWPYEGGLAWIALEPTLGLDKK